MLTPRLVGAAVGAGGLARGLSEGVGEVVDVGESALGRELGGVREGHVRLEDLVAVFGLGAPLAPSRPRWPRRPRRLRGRCRPIQKHRDAVVEAGADFEPLRKAVGLELKKATNWTVVVAIEMTSGSEQVLFSGQSLMHTLLRYLYRRLQCREIRPIWKRTR